VSGHVGFVVDKMAVGHVSSEYFGFPCQSSFHQLLHSHHHHLGLVILPKVQALVVQVVEVQLRDVEAEVPVEVQLTVTSTDRRSCRSLYMVSEEVVKLELEGTTLKLPSSPRTLI
jgi:hypothetical protein